jgi:hypothetical protein
LVNNVHGAGNGLADAAEDNVEVGDWLEIPVDAVVDVVAPEPDDLLLDGPHAAKPVSANTPAQRYRHFIWVLPVMRSFLRVPDIAGAPAGIAVRR